MSNDPKGFNPEYDDNKKLNTIHWGNKTRKSDGSTYRKVELLMGEDVSYLSEKNKETDSVPVEFAIKENVTLFQSHGGQQKIQCWLIETISGKYVQAIHISRRTGKGVYGSQEVTLSFDAIFALRDFLNNLTLVDNDDRTRIAISTETANDEKETKKLLTEREFVELIKANIKNTDDFYKLLSIQKMETAVEYFGRIIEGEYKNEVDIQRFLRENIWMFGNDYVYIIENNQINTANILDMVPQNFESYVDIIEVKLPSENLFSFDESHKNYYPTSHLTKAIAQTQNYIFELEKKTVDEDYQQKRDCKVIKPKGIILYGSQRPLNEGESQYLRVLNSSYHNLQIITYQQLMEKAKNTLRLWKDIGVRPK